MARHAPGLSPSELQQMTPEETRYVRKAILDELELEERKRLSYVKALMQAAGARVL